MQFCHNSTHISTALSYRASLVIELLQYQLKVIYVRRVGKAQDVTALCQMCRTRFLGPLCKLPLLIQTSTTVFQNSHVLPSRGLLISRLHQKRGTWHFDKLRCKLRSASSKQGERNYKEGGQRSKRKESQSAHATRKVLLNPSFNPSPLLHKRELQGN